MQKATSIEQLSEIVQAAGEQLNKNIIEKGKTLLDKETFQSKTDPNSVNLSDAAKVISGYESAVYPSYYGKNSTGEVGFHSFIGESEQIKNNFSTNILDAKTGEVHIIDLVNKDIYCSSVIQPYKFIETDDNITLTKVFNNADQSNFFNEPEVEFKDNKCTIKKQYNYISEINLDGYYYTDLIDLSTFLEINDVDLYSTATSASGQQQINISSISLESGKSVSGDLQSLISSTLPTDYAVLSYNDNGQYILNLDGQAYISKVRIYNRPDSQYSETAPNRIIVYIMDNSGTWKSITDRSNIGYAEYIDIAVNKLCSKIKIYTVSSNGSSNAIYLRSLQAFGTTCKYLLQDENGKYFSFNESTYDTTTKKYNEVQLSEFATDNVSYDIKDLLKEVTIGEEIFRPIDKFSKIKIVFNSDINFIMYGIKVNKQLVIGSRSFSMKLARDVENFTPTYTVSDGGKIRVVCSNNDGVSWYTHNGTGWVELTNKCPLKAYSELTEEELSQFNLFKDEVYTSGLDIQSLSSVDFNTLNNNKTMRFAYVLNVGTYDSICSMSKLDFIFKAKGTFVQMSTSEVKVQLSEDFISITPLADYDFMKINVGISDKFATVVEIDMSTDEEVTNEITNLKDRLTL